MKRSLFILAIFLCSSARFGLLRLKTRAIRAEGEALLKEHAEVTNESWRVETQLAALREGISERKAEIEAHPQSPFLDVELANWLLAGSFRDPPANIVPKLRAALGLPWPDSGDCVLVSKGTLRSLSVDPIQRKDKLSDTLCAVLAIAPEARAQIEAAIARTREQFSEWARANMQREGPSNDALVKFTIPSSEEASSAMTNQFYSALQGALGAERSDLFNGYADSWFQTEFGYLGAVTNSLTVRNSVDSSGKTNFEFVLSRDGIGRYGQMTHSGPLDPQNFPPAFRNIFPGGWKEIAEREGFEFPVREAVP